MVAVNIGDLMCWLQDIGDGTNISKIEILSLNESRQHHHVTNVTEALISMKT